MRLGLSFEFLIVLNFVIPNAGVGFTVVLVGFVVFGFWPLNFVSCCMLIWALVL